MFEPWQSFAIDDASYNGICDEHIECVANSLLSTSAVVLYGLETRDEKP